MARWGNCDYRQLQKLRENLDRLQSADLENFCRDVSKELAARLLALVIPRTPVGDYSKEVTVTVKRDGKHHKKGGHLHQAGDPQRQKRRHPAPGLDGPNGAGGRQPWREQQRQGLCPSPAHQKAGRQLPCGSHQPRPLCQLCGVWPPHARRRLGRGKILPYHIGATTEGTGSGHH